MENNDKRHADAGRVAPGDESKSVFVRLHDSNGRIQMAEGPWQEQRDCLTGTPEFFVINHYDRPEQIAPSDYRLAVVSGGETLRELDYEEIRSLPSVTIGAVVECAGMSRGFLPTPAPGQQFGHGLVGNAVWTGTSVRAVLEACHSDVEFDTLVVRGRDGGVTKPEDTYSDYGKGLPRLKALHQDTLLAWEMNGEPLPHLHGGPIRLVVPGWFGTWWVKWIHSLELIQGPYDGFWQTTRYSYQGGDFGHPEIVAGALPRSVICDPAEGHAVTNGPVQFRGYAWAGENSITSVELSTDGGATWIPCDRAGQCGRYGWIEWTKAVQLPDTEGEVTVAVRATDSAGRTQNWQSKPNRLGYGNNGIHVVTLIRQTARAKAQASDSND